MFHRQPDSTWHQNWRTRRSAEQDVWLSDWRERLEQEQKDD